MKIALTGSTGFIGSAVLERCLSHPSITSVVAITRRPLQATHTKLVNIVQADFLHYDESVLSKLAGTEACIWCLGTPMAGREVHVDYTVAAVNAFADNLVPTLRSGKKFRFVYFSGGLAERDQRKSLWFLNGGRKMRGEIENKLADFQTQHADNWASFCARPWFVTNGESALRFFGHNLYIPVHELAAAVVDVAITGDGTVFIDNADLKVRGKIAVEALK